MLRLRRARCAGTSERAARGRALCLLFTALALLVLAPAAATAPVPPSFVYVHANGTPNQVFGFAIGGDGALTELAGSPFGTNNTTSNCGGTCETAAYSSARRLLVTAGGDGLSVSRVATDGTLTLVAGSPFGALRFLGVTTIELGATTFVYAAETDADQVRGYAVLDDDTLSELPTSPYAAGMQLDGLVGARTFVFAASDATPAVAAFKVQADGALVAAEGSPFAVAADSGCTQNVFVDPKGTFVYVPDFCSDPIRVFGFRVRKKDAALFRIKGSPFPVGIGGVSALALRKSSSLYVFGPPSGGEGDIQYLRRTTSGALLRGGISNTGLTLAWAGGVDPSGKVLVLAGDDPAGAQAASWLIGKKGKLATVGRVPLTGAAANRINAIVFATP